MRTTLVAGSSSASGASSQGTVALVTSCGAQSPSGDKVENRRYRGARHGAADVQMYPTGVELEEGQRRFGYELADRGAPPPIVGEPERRDQPVWRAGAVNGDREGTQRPPGVAFNDLGAELLCHCQPIRIGVDVRDRCGS